MCLESVKVGSACASRPTHLPASPLRQQWREPSTRDLSSLMPAIVRERENSIIDIARLVEERERQSKRERQCSEAQRESWRREEDLRRAAIQD